MNQLPTDPLSNLRPDTFINTPSGEKALDRLDVSSDVLVATGMAPLVWEVAQVAYKSGIGPEARITMALLELENEKHPQLICMTDQPFLLHAGKMARVMDLVPGESLLVDQSGKPVRLLHMHSGTFTGGVAAISTNRPWNGMPAGHLLLANGVVCGDWTLLAYFSQLSEEWI